jgi:predicted nucleic acid-binding protein
MIAYVESNFFLEIALGQEQAMFAKAILSLAEQDKIELAFPSFALSEPFTTLTYRRGRRSSLYRELEVTLKEIKRSEALRPIAQNMETLIVALKQAQGDDFDPLHSVLARMLAAGRSIETDLSIFADALAYQASLGLLSQDSIIYAAVINDLKKRPASERKCFLSRDKSAFSEIVDFEAKKQRKAKFEAGESINLELKQYNCQYMSNFENGLNFIQRFCSEK